MTYHEEVDIGEEATYTFGNLDLLEAEENPPQKTVLWNPNHPKSSLGIIQIGQMVMHIMSD